MSIKNLLKEIEKIIEVRLEKIFDNLSLSEKIENSIKKKNKEISKSLNINKKVVNKNNKDKISKEPNSGYLKYQSTIIPELKKEFPELKYKDLLTKVSEKWNKTDIEEKKLFLDLALEDYRKKVSGLIDLEKENKKVDKITKEVKKIKKVINSKPKKQKEKEEEVEIESTIYSSNDEQNIENKDFENKKIITKRLIKLK